MVVEPVEPGWPSWKIIVFLIETRVDLAVELIELVTRWPGDSTGSIKNPVFKTLIKTITNRQITYVLKKRSKNPAI